MNNMNNLTNDFEARYAMYLALGGEPKEFANIFEVDLAILDIIESGIGGDFKTNHYMDADGRLIVERGEDGRTVISDEHENPIIERLADGTTKIFDAYQGERMTISANGDITFQELTTLGTQVASNTEAIRQIAASGGASTAEAVIFADGESLATKMPRKTEKIRVDIVASGSTYKFMLGSQELNFADLNRMLQETPDFVVFVHDNREHRCVRIELDGGTKFMEFTSPIIEGVNTKVQSFLVTSVNGTQIFTVRRTDIINENKTDADKVREDIETAKQNISDLDNKTTNVIYKEGNTYIDNSFEFVSDDYDSDSGTGEKYAEISPYGIKANGYYDTYGNNVIKDNISPELVLPSYIPSVAGIQTNIYLKNVLLGKPFNNIAKLHCDYYQMNQSRVSLTSSVTSETNTTLNFELFEHNTLDNPITKQLNVKFIPANAGGNKSIKALIIGDSKVAGGYVSQHLLHNFDNDSVSCTLLGSLYTWSESNRHEGRSGWTAKDFCTKQTPFLNNGTFDFSHYMTSQGYDSVDFVFINLGTNDMSNPNIDTAINDYISSINTMISSIKLYNSNINIIIGMNEGRCMLNNDADGLFKSYDVNQKSLLLHKKQFELYAGRENEHIYLCPLYMSIDLDNDYNMEERPLSSRDNGINNKKRLYVLDPIHQNEVGYWKNSDYMYNLIKYIIK